MVFEETEHVCIQPLQGLPATGKGLGGTMSMQDIFQLIVQTHFVVQVIETTILHIIMVFERIVDFSDESMLPITAVMLVIYYFVFEVWLQKTIGKMVTKTKVVMADGSKPTASKILLRSIIRIVPFEPFSSVGTKKEQRTWWHDRWTKTRVVKE